MSESAPFTKGYVLRATIKHMRKCVDISLDKTKQRWPEFRDSPEKSKEIAETLMRLQDIRQSLDKIPGLTEEDFMEKNDG